MGSITTKNILTKQYDSKPKNDSQALYWLLKEVNDECHSLANVRAVKKDDEYFRGAMDAFNSVYVRILELIKT
ncbi:hypothetical protein ES705_16851 [subsurface metagenome]